MQQILNTLYVMTPNAYVHLENDTLRIDVEREKKMQVPLHHLGSVVCFGNVMLSPALMHRCADDGISLVLLDGNGRFKARLEGRVSGNILLRQAQHRAASDAGIVLDAARAVIAGKLRNCRQVLLRGARETSDPSDQATLGEGAEYLAQSVRTAGVAGDLDALRGIEGDAARNYFACVGCLIRKDLREDFAMNGRTRRPPLDRFNALLSFLYSMLMNDCRSALESVGLDPQLRPGGGDRGRAPAPSLDDAGAALRRERLLRVNNRYRRGARRLAAVRVAWRLRQPGRPDDNVRGDA